MDRMLSSSASHDTMTAQNALESPLLRLPAEIRNHIFVYIFTCEEAYHLRYHTDVRKSAIGQHLGVCSAYIPPWLGLIRACGQCNAESALLPHTLNSFHIDQGNKLKLLIPHLCQLQNPLTILRLDISSKVGFNERIKIVFADSLPPSVEKLEVKCFDSKESAYFISRDPELNDFRQNALGAGLGCVAVVALGLGWLVLHRKKNRRATGVISKDFTSENGLVMTVAPDIAEKDGTERFHKHNGKETFEMHVAESPSKSTGDMNRAELADDRPAELSADSPTELPTNSINRD
ncbi:hypothetical protein HBI24_157740 [Parastagonospora nodorum]|nr:hypothetical protein HBH96_161770 [Parastagonospora nodorum]KAH5578813.1 hypothetical protein HBI24_157740 [Parastagonospora nodorum]KAH6067683.1 hypothetical protein HBI66_148040 [Parastagonospora nodorum]KAH6077312.1 hypothetical protein HBI67_042030 [Parastagonospora nodorum]KAH6405482.1 hypothetical protein HBI60_028030 [Parastagonospora nodorum]